MINNLHENSLTLPYKVTVSFMLFMYKLYNLLLTYYFYVRVLFQRHNLNAVFANLLQINCLINFVIIF